MNEIVNTKWVTLKRYCEMSGDSQRAIYVRRAKGLWADGVQTKKVPGVGVMVNMEEVTKWIDNCQSASR